MEFENFTAFIEHYKNDALTINLQQDATTAFNVYTSQKFKLQEAELESEIEEVKTKSEASIKHLKENLQLHFQNNLKAKYINHTPLFLINIRFYFLYKELYSDALKKITDFNHIAKRTPQYTIIDFLHFDLNLALSLIYEQIQLNDYKKYIITSNRELFDYVTLGKYLQELNNPNPYVISILKELLEKSKHIIDLDREVMGNIERSIQNKDIFHQIDFKEHGFINLSNNYQCLRINNTTKSIINLHTEKNRENFIKKNDYKIFDTNDFAHKCGTIFNRITLFFGLNSIEDVKIFVSQNKILQNTQKDYTGQNWFKIGLLFATGEMERLLTKHNKNCTQIAAELGNMSGYRPYISDSIGVKKTTSSKSIFSSKEKMERILAYCEKSKIDVIDSFKNSLPIQ